MESLYKRKNMVGLADKGRRRDLNRQYSRAKKEELMDSKRMPLGELNVADSGKNETGSKKTKQENRLEQLREWQKARQQAKAKENAAKKPTFSLGKAPRSNFNLHINTSGKAFSQENNLSVQKTKPVDSVAKQVVVTKKKTDGLEGQHKVKREPAVRKTKNLAETSERNIPQPKRTRPLAKTQPLPIAKEAPKPQQPRKSQRPKSAQQPVKKPQPKVDKSIKNDVKANKNTKRVPQKQTSSSRVPPVRQSTRLANKPSTVSTRKPNVIVAPPSSPPPSLSPTPSQSSLPLVVEVPPVPPPSTPSKKTYTPICPSPLLHSRSATYRANSEPATIPSAFFVDEPAWVPGAIAPEGLSDDKFENFKNSFSPFKFGNSESNFQFKFKMDSQVQPSCDPTTHEEASSSCDRDKIADVAGSTPVLSLDRLTIASPPLQEEEKKNTSAKKTSPYKTPVEGHLNRSPIKGRRRSSRMVLTYEEEEEKLQSSDDTVTAPLPMSSQEVKEESAGGNEEESAGGNEEESAGKTSDEIAVSHSPNRGKRRRSQTVLKYEEDLSEAQSVPEEIPDKSTEASDGLDIPRFRKLHSDVCEKLTALCEVWEAKISALEESDSSLEEVLGQIRSATGSARLLMKQKLKQYIGLVDTAETQSGHRKTTAEDLQGFWDMVYYQVDSLFRMFTDLDDLEKNNWTAPQPSPKKPKIQKKSMNKKPRKAATVEASSERAEAARKKMLERRAELKRLKMRACQQAKEEEENMKAEVQEEKTEVKEVAEEEVHKEVENEEEPVTKSEEHIDQSMQESSCAGQLEPRELQRVNKELQEPVYPSPLRRSARIRNRSIFSPMCSPVLPAKQRKHSPQKELHQAPEDVPTGMLISF